ncbi:MAG: histidine phosphatase family protein [Planctomycetota bacterium]|nr:histidine phosphatase family protein [Planctomycetota bacterium]
MTRIVLIRHGEVHADWRGRLYGAMDVPLSEVGMGQARAVALELRGREFAQVVSSGLERAEFTAQLLRSDRPGMRRLDDPRFMERSRGDWAGMSPAEIDRRQPGASELWASSRGMFDPPAGESVEQVLERVESGLHSCLDSKVDGDVVIVAHLWVLRAALALTVGLPAEQVGRIDIPTAGRIEISWADRGSPGAKGELHGLFPAP